MFPVSSSESKLGCIRACERACVLARNGVRARHCTCSVFTGVSVCRSCQRVCLAVRIPSRNPPFVSPAVVFNSLVTVQGWRREQSIVR